VVEVIDGDTVRLNNGKSLRYLGINAPETRLRNGNDWEKTESYWGNRALELNAKLVLNKKVRIKYDRKMKDRFRRLLGYVFVDGVMVNAEILRRGLAVIDVRYPNYKYVNELADAFLKGVKTKSGIWEHPYKFHLLDLKNYIGEIGIFGGKVLEVAETKSTILILFPRDFRAVIFKDNLGLFKDIDLNLKGKRVKVYGMLKKYKGNYEIIVHHPYQLEVIE
jgi:micrococcal nuclease